MCFFFFKSEQVLNRSVILHLILPTTITEWLLDRTKMRKNGCYQSLEGFAIQPNCGDTVHRQEGISVGF